MNGWAKGKMRAGQIIVGIDPGTRQIGYALLAVLERSWRVMDCGIFRPPKGLALPQRLAWLFNEVTALLREHAVHCVVVEEPHVRPFNMRSALVVAQSVGVIKAAAASLGVPIVSYPYTQVKRTLTGSGNASRLILTAAVRQILRLADLPPWQDAVDALAFALCHCLLSPSEVMATP
ncbi:MAG: hypothetical protein SLRJCFUN_002137 [Candidatus Fervidibacter sp.]